MARYTYQDILRLVAAGANQLRIGRVLRVGGPGFWGVYNRARAEVACMSRAERRQAMRFDVVEGGKVGATTADEDDREKSDDERC